MNRQHVRILAISLSATLPLLAQSNQFYAGSNVTGQVVLAGTTNAAALAQAAAQAQSHLASHAATSIDRLAFARGQEFEWLINPNSQKRFLAPIFPQQGPEPALPTAQSLAVEYAPSSLPTLSPEHLASHSITVSPASNAFGFLGLTHLDQRNANGGNQLNIEPPSPNIAVGNGFILEGVNNAIQVYDRSGNPLLATVISTNQLFNLAPGFNRTTNVFGPTPTDMRVFYDPTINRFFVIQRLQPSDAFGNPLPQSEEIIAASQSGDPTGNYNIYTIDTTHSSAIMCPCVADYPQIGADQFGLYISANEYNAFNDTFALQANILAISKVSLAAGSSTPTAYKFEIPFSSGYEFSIQPAAIPPGASNFLASGGLEYFVSSLISASGNTLSIWALVNTSSLLTSNPNLTLVRTIIPSLSYVTPNVATQQSGPRPYGGSFIPPLGLETIDGGDTRILSATYSGGRLYAVLATGAQDGNGTSVVGSAYFVISPTYRGGVLAAKSLYQGYIITNNNHLLRPAIAVNPQGSGAIVFTLTGPSYYPSAAFVPFSSTSPGSAIQIAGAGAFPEDGFSGYSGNGVARWGDYSAATVDSDGSIFMGTEFIPNSPRAQKANWGTYLIHYIP